MASAPTLDEVIGRNLRRIREERGETQDHVAIAVNEWGLSWSRPTVTALEMGEKSVSVSELVLLCEALGVSVPQLLADLDDSGKAVQLRNSAPWEAHSLPNVRDILAGARPKQWHFGPMTVIPAVGEAERKAARKLGVDVNELIRPAHRRWKRSLTMERDARVSAAAPPDATPRTLQALRGHVTRELVAELAADMGLEPKKKAAP